MADQEDQSVKEYYPPGAWPPYRPPIPGFAEFSEPVQKGLLLFRAAILEETKPTHRVKFLEPKAPICGDYYLLDGEFFARSLSDLCVGFCLSQGASWSEAVLGARFMYKQWITLDESGSGYGTFE